MSDEPLSADDAVYRRFLRTQFVPDANLGRMRLSSAAFERRSGEEHLSCYIESIMVAHDLLPERVLDGHPRLGSARITVATLRSHGYDAKPDPDGIDPAAPHPCDVAHGAILEPDLSGKPLKRRAGELASDDAVTVLTVPPEN